MALRWKMKSYSFLTILWQSSQRSFLNRCPGSGTALQMRQTHPLSRHRSAHTRSFSRSVSSVKGRTPDGGALLQLHLRKAQRKGP
jgi:hypothetical protein